jgi:hypothetical protein
MRTADTSADRAAGANARKRATSTAKEPFPIPTVAFSIVQKHFFPSNSKQQQNHYHHHHQQQQQQYILRHKL